MMETRTSPPRNKLMLVVNFLLFILCVVFVVLKFYVLNIGGEWTNSQVFDDVFILGISSCFILFCIGYAYYAWTLTADDFLDWFQKQAFVPKWQKETGFERDYVFIFRYIYPIGALFAILGIGLKLFSIIRYLLK